jgi:hypothetical protein
VALATLLKAGVLGANAAALPRVRRAMRSFMVIDFIEYERGDVRMIGLLYCTALYCTVLYITVGSTAAS